MKKLMIFGVEALALGLHSDPWRRKAMKLAATAIMIFLAIGGCSEKDQNCVQAPQCPDDTSRTSTPDPTIWNIWPNEDHATWTYSYSIKQNKNWEGPIRYYPTPDAIPAFTWEEVQDLLNS
ncbi:MAG: hypothetical protein NTW97_08330, partial [Candidatus Krumholzibacteria bacterium]|nr:hypothetical protein [Candidatus Krumholzibacteria bacterium]